MSEGWGPSVSDDTSAAARCKKPMRAHTLPRWGPASARKCMWLGDSNLDSEVDWAHKGMQ